MIIRFALIDQKLQVQLHDDALMFDLWPLYLHLAASLPARKYLLITLHLSHHYDKEDEVDDVDDDSDDDDQT